MSRTPRSPASRQRPAALNNRHRLRRVLLGITLVTLGLILVIALPVWFRLEYPEVRPVPERELAENWQLPLLKADGRHVLLLMIDGLAVEPFQRALAEGRMPNLERLMSSRPTSQNVAIATFPSATSPSVQELLSGRYIDLSDLPGPSAVHAFDRDQRTVFRYVTEPDVWQWPVPTLFDAVGDREAVTVFEGRWDGPLTILTQYNLIGQAFLEAIGASALSGGDRGPVEAYLKLLRDGASPVVSLIVLNEFDMLAHFHGPQSAEAQRALSDSDALIGEILDALAHTTGSRGSLLDETSLVLFGDHGMAQSGHYIDLRDFFAERGLNAIDVATVGHVLFRERLGSLWTNWTDVILVAGGSNITQVYLKDPERGWRAPLLDGADHPGAENDHDTVSRLAPDLARREGIGQVFWLEALDVVRVLAGDGSRARVMARGEGPERVYAYLVEPDAESDPFGYLANPATRPLVCHGPSAASECFHSVTEWFDASVSTGYPGAVPLLPKAFRASQFAGDLMVAAARGYTFLRGQQGDHGNLDRQAMLTPLIFNGPGVSACQERHQPRLVDIYPSVAVLLGAARDDPALTDLDGRVLDCVANPASALRPGRRL